MCLRSHGGGWWSVWPTGIKRGSAGSGASPVPDMINAAAIMDSNVKGRTKVIKRCGIDVPPKDVIRLSFLQIAG